MQQIGFLLQNLLFAQHVSGTIMPIIRSSRFIQMVAACGTWHFGLQVVGLVWSSTPAQDLYRWLLPVVLGTLVYRWLVWCGAPHQTNHL